METVAEIERDAEPDAVLRLSEAEMLTDFDAETLVDKEAVVDVDRETDAVGIAVAVLVRPDTLRDLVLVAEIDVEPESEMESVRDGLCEDDSDADLVALLEEEGVALLAVWVPKVGVPVIGSVRVRDADEVSVFDKEPD